MAGAPLKDDLELDALLLLGFFLGTKLADRLRHGYADLAALGAACGASAAQVSDWLSWEQTPPPHQARRFMAAAYAAERRDQLANRYRPRDPQAEVGLTASQAFGLA
jgi:hypothetical protein